MGPAQTAATLAALATWSSPVHQIIWYKAVLVQNEAPRPAYTPCDGTYNSRIPSRHYLFHSFCQVFMLVHILQQTPALT
jgi:hypothetical protein